ncbi:MAG: hypothetical protein OSA98_19405 [Rubripirellula sp.]|nr:hypothetical protein [Rubripirellula sp.]
MSETTGTLKPQTIGVLEPDTHVTGIQHSPCGKVLCGASFDQTVRRWDLTTDEFPPPALPSVTGHNGFVSGVAFRPSQGVAYSADSWGRLQAWPYLAENPDPLWSINEAHDGWIRGLAVAADGERLVTCGRDKMVRMFDTNDGKLIREFSGHREDVFALAVHPSGQWVVSADLLGRIVQWDVATGEIVREFDGSDFHLLHRLQDIAGIRKLSFAAGGKTLIVSGGFPSGGANVRGHAHVRLIDFKSGETTHDMPIGEENKDVFAHDVHLHPDGFFIIVTTGQPGQGSLLFQRPGEKEPLYKLNKGTINCHSISMAPDGKRFVVSATNTGSNGNGQRLDKEGKYIANHSPLHFFELT